MGLYGVVRYETAVLEQLKNESEVVWMEMEACDNVTVQLHIPNSRRGP